MPPTMAFPSSPFRFPEFTSIRFSRRESLPYLPVLVKEKNYIRWTNRLFGPSSAVIGSGCGPLQPPTLGVEKPPARAPPEVLARRLLLV